RQSQSSLDLPLLDGPTYCLPQIVELRRQPPDVLRVKQFKRGTFRLRQKPVTVPPEDGIRFSSAPQVFSCILAHRLQQPVASASFHVVNVDQRRVHESGQQVKHVLRSDPAARTDCLGSLQTPATDECR